MDKLAMNENKDVQKQDEQNVESTRGYFYTSPDTDIYETDDEFKMIYEIPGVEKTDVNIKVEKDVLTMTAECSKSPVSGNECLRAEMDFVGYKRSFNLNNLVDVEKIKADYSGGVLALTLPKLEEKKTKEIKITVA